MTWALTIFARDRSFCFLRSASISCAQTTVRYDRGEANLRAIKKKEGRKVSVTIEVAFTKDFQQGGMEGVSMTLPIGGG